MPTDLRQVAEDLARLKEQVDALQMGLTPSGGGWEAAAGECVDQAQTIDSETPTAGVATTPPRSDGKEGLSLAGDPGDQVAAAEPKQTLGFWKLVTVGTRWGLGIIFGTHTVGANHYPSLEGAEDAGGTEGARLRIGSYGTNRSALDVQSDGVGLPLDPAGAIEDGGSGPAVNAGDGLQIDANALEVKPDTSGLAVSVSAAGIKVAGPKLDDLATPDDNTDLNAGAARHGLLAKLSGTGTDYVGGDNACHALPAAGGTFTALDSLVYSPDDLTADGAWHDLDLSALIPAGGKAVSVYISVEVYTGYQIMVRKNGGTYGLGATQGGTGTGGVIAVDANRVIEYMITSGAVANIYLLGYWT